MTKTVPTYLRLHTDSPRRRAAAVSLDPLSRFWQAYTTATGWRAERSPRKRRGGEASRAKPSQRGMRLQPAIDNALMGPIEGLDAAPAVSQQAAQRLAVAAWELVDQYQGTLQALERQEAELAATATPIETAEAGNPLADRLQGFLRQSLEATGCQAAALYMLDTDTTALKLRACAGLPLSRLAAPPRPLRGSRGDLEALVRDVVLIDDLQEGQAGTWNSPEPLAAAMVVRVEEDAMPIGTLWLWAAAPRSFSPGDGAAARLAAVGIASELARAKLSRDRHRSALHHHGVQAAAQWQLRQLPPAMELSPGYFVDGWTESPHAWASSWHAWEILPDGTLAFALAEAESREFCSAMIAATARAALAAHSHYRHSVTDMLGRISDSLWQTNSGDQIVSMLYVHLNPETGEGQLASAGSIQAIIAGAHGHRAIGGGRSSDPLGSRIDCRLAHTAFRLQPSEVLVAVNRGVLDAATAADRMLWAEIACQAVVSEEGAVLPAVRRALADQPLRAERAGAMLLRKV